MNIGLLECDDVVGRFQHIHGGYREMFAALLPGHDFSYFEAHRGRLPHGPGDCDAWICTGSKYSVYEQHDWISGLSRFIRAVHRAERPFVGICFGHQMLAHALGGQVEQAMQGWGVGVLKVEILRQEPWMIPPRPAISIQHIHQDQVLRLPADSVVLGRSEHCAVEMFQVGKSMLGIEGHPEFTPAYGEALIRARRERIGEKRAEQALASLRQPTDSSVVAKWIANFVASARSSGS